MGSENPYQPLSRKQHDSLAYFHTSTCPGWKHDLSRLRVVWDLDPLKTLLIFFH
ncbi:hypothetical protein MXB_4928 [Myxobolus squamalis]|nr:hypothetical protein MXB_4928 [Myxobolus squamalis]